MIILYRNKEGSFADKIAAQLEDLVVAHKVTVINEEQSEKKSLPYLQEGDHVIQGENNIVPFLTQLANELEEQRRVTGDACYIDPESGDVC